MDKIVEVEIQDARARAAAMDDHADSRFLTAQSYLTDAESYVTQAREYVHRALRELESEPEEFTDDGAAVVRIRQGWFE